MRPVPAVVIGRTVASPVLVGRTARAGSAAAPIPPGAVRRPQGAAQATSIVPLGTSQPCRPAAGEVATVPAPAVPPEVRPYPRPRPALPVTTAIGRPLTERRAEGPPVAGPLTTMTGPQRIRAVAAQGRGPTKGSPLGVAPGVRTTGAAHSSLQGDVPQGRILLGRQPTRPSVPDPASRPSTGQTHC